MIDTSLIRKNELIDASLLRDEDVAPTREVVAFLNAKGLDVVLGGSALKGDKLYADVDLLATGAEIAAQNVIRSLERTGAEPFLTKTKSGSEYKVWHAGRGLQYLGTMIDDRYGIIAGKTVIDLSIKSFR